MILHKKYTRKTFYYILVNLICIIFANWFDLNVICNTYRVYKKTV